MATTLRTLFALALVAGVWWSMAALALSFDTIKAGVRELNTSPPAREGLLIFDDHSSLCCDDFNTALALSLWLTSFSAIPMCLIAMSLKWRRAPLKPSAISEAVLRAAMIFQGASFGTNLLFAYGFASYGGGRILEPIILILLGQALVAIVAVPVWYRLSRETAPMHGLAV